MTDLADPMGATATVQASSIRSTPPASFHFPASSAGAGHAFRIGLVNAAATCLALPALAMVALLLLILNPFVNRGPVFFCQQRLGRGGQAFRIERSRLHSVACTVAAPFSQDQPGFDVRLGGGPEFS